MARPIILVPVMAALLAGSPSRAQETAATLADRTALIEARTALEKARADKVDQRLDRLGLKSDAMGKTVLTEGGGGFEGWLLSSRAIEAAAVVLNADLARLDVGREALVLLAGDETFDMTLPSTMRERLSYLSKQASDTLSSASCAAGGADAPTGTLSFAPGAMAALGAVVGSFRTDTTVTGFAGPDAARMVIAALVATRTRAEATPAAWIVPGDIMGVQETSPMLVKWAEIVNQRAKIAECRAGLARQGDGTKVQVDRLDAQTANIDDFSSKQIGAGDGASPLVKAMQVDGVASLKPMILRVYVEKAGGSILNRRNLWTALGAPAVGITGGAVIGWRLGDPSSGEVVGGGNLVCRTELTGMRAIQNGRVRPSDCSWMKQVR